MTAKPIFIRPSESRRGFIRVDFDSGSKVGIENRLYDALDLSVYGVSFLAKPADAPQFQMGAELKALDFSIGDRRIQVSAKVAHLQPGLTAGLTKVAVEFVEIDIDDVWHLSSFIARKSGVDSPEDVGEINVLAQPSKAKAKPQSKAKAKPKAKAKAKSKAKSKKAPKKKTKPKTKVKAKTKAKSARKKSARRK